LLVLGALLFASGGCDERHRGWEPPLEETSTHFLHDRVVEALHLVRDAQKHVPTDAEQAARDLDGAMRALRLMSEYYLPLLEARERAYDAHRLLYHGETRRSRSEIEAVEKILSQIAEAGGPALLPLLKEPLGLASEAKAAILATSDEAPDLIESLAIKLNYMALKGELELPPDWPPAPSPDD
jgi:hypothetical protein